MFGFLFAERPQFQSLMVAMGTLLTEPQTGKRYENIKGLQPGWIIVKFKMLSGIKYLQFTSFELPKKTRTAKGSSIEIMHGLMTTSLTLMAPLSFTKAIIVLEAIFFILGRP